MVFCIRLSALPPLVMASLLRFCAHPEESSENLFFSCHLADILLSWVQSLLFSVSPLCPTLLLRHVLFGFSEDELRCVPRFFVYLLNVCKFLILCACNDFRFHDVRPSAIDVIESVEVRVRFYLPLFFRHFQSSHLQRYFVCQWGARGVIASIVDSCLVVSL